MSERAKKALENRKKGYNCAQAVACAYSDKANIDEETVFKMSEGFGSGMGGMKYTCGAISAAVMLAGLKSSSGDLNNPNTKAKTYKLSKEIAKRFEEKNGSAICSELKGIGTNKVLRSCEGCISDVAQIIDEIVFNDDKK